MNIKNIVEFINSGDINAKERTEEDSLKYLIFNGRLREVILDKILREFEDPQTIKELTSRIVPINIMKKTISKLAQVYKNDPIRRPADLLPADEELIINYERSLNINQIMQYANKLFKLHKHVVVEPFLDRDGIPRLRAVPSQSFWIFSDDAMNPERMTTYVKLIKDGEEEERRYSMWTDEEHWIVDGKGAIDRQAMIEMGNEEGKNRFGRIPAIHINESIDLLYPIRPTDILSVQFAICLLLSDTTLAQKYLSWGTLLISGGDGDENIKVGAGAVLNLPALQDGSKPDAKYIQPELKSDEVLKLVDKLVEYLLATNNLSAGTIIGKAQVSTASGISKMLDEVQSTEDKEEQRKYFESGERDLWDLFAHYMLPVWTASGEINQEYKGAFSNGFEINIIFKDMKPMLTEKEQVELVIVKLNAGLITQRDAIKELNPSLTDEQVEEKISDIAEERTVMLGDSSDDTEEEDNEEADDKD